MKGRRETSSFYRFQKPKNEHKRRRKQMLYDPYSKDFKQGKKITLQDLPIVQEIDDKS
jgi:hypothetical protein